MSRRNSRRPQNLKASALFLAVLAALPLAAHAIDPAQRKLLDENWDFDVALALPGVGRFRASFYKQQRGWDGVFRTIPPEPPTLESLGLPASLSKLTDYHQGLVLVTGPAGPSPPKNET